MSIVGYAAADGIFLDLPPFLRGLAQSLNGPDCPGLRLSQEMYDEVQRLRDLEDPTEIVDEYYQAWWTQSEHCNTIQPPLVDMWAAIQFHKTKVSFGQSAFPHISPTRRGSVWPG